MKCLNLNIFIMTYEITFKRNSNGREEKFHGNIKIMEGENTLVVKKTISNENYDKIIKMNTVDVKKLIHKVLNFESTFLDNND